MTLEAIKEKLKRVRCYHTANEIDLIIKQAQENEISYLKFMDNILDNELSTRRKNRIRKNLKKSGFPQIKTIEEFDFNFQTSITKRMSKEWFCFDWIEQRSNKIFMGPPGVGKTHLALSLGYAAIMEHYKVRFYTLKDLMEEMILSDDENRFEYFLKKLLKHDLLIIDELGYLPFNPKYANLFFQLINGCYEYRSIIITSNKLYQEWGELFGNQTIAAAILDRLLHHSESIIIQGDSYRLKDVSEPISNRVYKKEDYLDMVHSTSATPPFHSPYPNIMKPKTTKSNEKLDKNNKPGV